MLLVSVFSVSVKELYSNKEEVDDTDADNGDDDDEDDDDGVLGIAGIVGIVGISFGIIPLLRF